MDRSFACKLVDHRPTRCDLREAVLIEKGQRGRGVHVEDDVKRDVIDAFHPAYVPGRDTEPRPSCTTMPSAPEDLIAARDAVMRGAARAITASEVPSSARLRGC